MTRSPRPAFSGTRPGAISRADAAFRFEHLDPNYFGNGPADLKLAQLRVAPRDALLSLLGQIPAL